LPFFPSFALGISLFAPEAKSNPPRPNSQELKAKK
jgi:hypothetical protein